MCYSGTESKTAHQCRGGVLITCYSIIYSDLPSGLFDHIALTFIFSCCSGGPQSAPPAALWHQIMIMNTGVRESQPDTVERHYLLSSNWMFLVRPLQYSRHNFTAEPSPRLASILTNLTLTRDDISTRDSLRRMTVSLQSAATQPPYIHRNDPVCQYIGRWIHSSLLVPWATLAPKLFNARNYRGDFMLYNLRPRLNSMAAFVNQRLLVVTSRVDTREVLRMRYARTELG